ncbi:Rrf2 family transcriptional regulator [Paenibacillus aurantius]|uniref:Rrf2 family transcriptional regulator n=1 Tax=Paenibacillus aurantius TaxID=2918900 RepID=A0AA96L9B4_9BACL|nr:Rrf2 family transcriptional regulator [Paenibacillus aurantius]WNQ09075.1 Rrf2 family transcriptional regulator [Paenibacillus aurantius]
MNSEFTIAVHSLVFLAYQPDRMASSDRIAHNVNTHPSRVRKVMSCLRKQGYVAAKEGIGGGFILSCDPEEVTLAEIYRATSMGTFKPSWCSGDTGGECMIACNMAEVMEGIFGEAEEQMMKFFERQTINGVLDRVRTLQKERT